MFDIDVKQNRVLSSNYEINWNEVFNEIKPNLMDFYY